MGPELIKKQAMRDPEIKKILEDPLMRRVLVDVQKNPQIINRLGDFQFLMEPELGWVLKICIELCSEAVNELL